MKINKWQKPTSNFCGMTAVLGSYILRSKSKGTFGIKDYKLSKVYRVVIHSYREVGTAVVVCCEIIFKDGHRKLGNITL